MQSDKKWFDEIKGYLDLEPRAEFLNESKQVLSKHAQKMKRNKQLKRKVIFTLSPTIILAMITWFAFFNGAEHLTNSFQSIMASISNNNENTSTVGLSKSTVFIYHTHNTESFTPLLNTDNPDEAFHNDQNITLVGKEIANHLEKSGINVIHDQTNIMEELDNTRLEYKDSYLVTSEILKDTLESNENIILALDIHRDYLDKSESTVNLDGIEFPKISFVISKNNNNYQENLKVAEIFHEKLQAKYPGVSKGVILTEGPDHGIYNQDLFSNSLLIQIGGVNNNLEEEYRGAEMLSEVIIDVLLEL